MNGAEVYASRVLFGLDVETCAGEFDMSETEWCEMEQADNVPVDPEITDWFNSMHEQLKQTIDTTMLQLSAIELEQGHPAKEIPLFQYPDDLCLFHQHPDWPWTLEVHQAMIAQTYAALRRAGYPATVKWIDL